MITLKNIINKVINKIIIFEYIYKSELEFIDDIKISDDIEFSEMTEKDIDNLKYTLGKEITDYKIEILKKRIDENGVKVFVLKEYSDVIGYCSLSFIDYKENGINKTIKIDYNQAYFFDDYICKKYRGKGLHYYSIIKRCEYAFKNGKSEGISCIYSWNKSSIINFERANFKKINKFIYIKIIKKLIECRV